jgi:hypothetical protein
VVIIGSGRIGTALQQRAAVRGIDVQLVGRSAGPLEVGGLQGDPIWVAVRNDDLRDVVPKVPHHRRDDLVFLQNGAIRGLLKDLGVSGCTRGLLYFAVAARGGPLVEGMVSPFCGPHALSSARFLSSIDLPAHALDWARFSYYEMEKLMWLSVHGVLCQRHQITVGEVRSAHQEALLDLVRELAAVGRAAMSVDAPVEHLVERLNAYSATIPAWRASVKEWDTRDGWWRSMARRYGVPTPQYDMMLDELGFAEAPLPAGR